MATGRTPSPLQELDTRWEYADPAFANGIAESFSIDQSKHSLFGASKVASDVMVQEYGRYFGMPTCCLRGGCLTGPNHSGVELHGFLSYLVKCNLEGGEYKVFGYKGKQVRDNIHAEDVARFMHEFCKRPRVGRGVQPGRRKGEFLLDSGGVRAGAGDHRAAAALYVRRGEPRRRPHLLLQRPAQDRSALPGLGITKPLRTFSKRSPRPGREASRRFRLAERGRRMKILITGICGFVGYRLARALAERIEGLEICGIDNLSRPGAEPNRARLRADGVKLFHGDLRLASDLEALPAVDWVIEAAANAERPGRRRWPRQQPATARAQSLEHGERAGVLPAPYCAGWCS